MLENGMPDMSKVPANLKPEVAAFGAKLATAGLQLPTMNRK